MTARPREPEQYRYIDALRGWAILLVVLTHAAQGQFAIDALSQATPRGPVLALPAGLALICHTAELGVQLFFVVSALSLALSWHARRETAWRNYVVRRFFRIAPMFYAGVVLYLLLFGSGPRLYAPNGIGLREVALTLGFVHIWSTNALNSVVPGDWSVGNEAMFYLVLPLLLMLARTPLRLAVLTAGAAAVAQTIAWAHLPYGPFGNGGFPSQAVVFLFGLCAAQCIASKVIVPRSRIAAASLFLFLVLLLPKVHLPEMVLSYPMQFGACGALLCILLHRAPVPILVSEPLVRLGRISFSIYILHFALFAPVFALARHLAPGANDLVLLAVYYPLLLAAAASCSALTYVVVERSGMRVGRQVIAWLEQRPMTRELVVRHHRQGGDSG